jgi:hypothetical protein
MERRLTERYPNTEIMGGGRIAQEEETLGKYEKKTL